MLSLRFIKVQIETEFSSDLTRSTFGTWIRGYKFDFRFSKNIVYSHHHLLRTHSQTCTTSKRVLWPPDWPGERDPPVLNWTPLRWARSVQPGCTPADISSKSVSCSRCSERNCRQNRPTSGRQSSPSCRQGPRSYSSASPFLKREFFFLRWTFKKFTGFTVKWFHWNQIRSGDHRVGEVTIPRSMKPSLAPGAPCEFQIRFFWFGSLWPGDRDEGLVKAKSQWS